MNDKENIIENEMFYKTICEKYVGTMNKEMLLEINNEILYIFIEDKYIDLKDEGKINTDNYKQYLEEEFSEFHYKSYSDLFSQVIKDNIKYDLNDLGVFDLDDKWDFYLTFEEIRKIGYGDIVKDNYPLIQEYCISEENKIEFFNQFTLEQLNIFEETLKYYFKEKNIKTLKEYGEDSNEGLYHFTDLYKDLLDKWNIKYTNIFTDEKEPGEYTTTIEFSNNNSISIDTKSHDDIKYLLHNLNFISNEYKKFMQKENEKAINEIDYEIN